MAGGSLEEVHFSLFGPGTFNAWLEAAVSMGLEPEGEQPPAPAPIHAQVPKLPAGWHGLLLKILVGLQKGVHFSEQGPWAQSLSPKP